MTGAVERLGCHDGRTDGRHPPNIPPSGAKTVPPAVVPRALRKLEAVPSGLAAAGKSVL